MSFHELHVFLSLITRYYKCIDYIYIGNTESASRMFPNFEYAIVLKPHIKRKTHRIYYSGKNPLLGEKRAKLPQNKINYCNNRDFNIRSIERKEKIFCDNYYEAGIYINQIIEGVNEYCEGINIEVFYAGENFSSHPKAEEKHLNTLYSYIYSHKRKTEKEIHTRDVIKMFEEGINKCETLEQLLKYLRDIFDSYTGYNELINFNNRLERIEKIITSQKKSYIMSKLKSGELKSEDVSQYPELINAVDELAKLKIVCGMR